MTISIVVLWAFLSTASAQMFVNLGFEDSRVPDLPLGARSELVSVAVAIPGWTAMIGEEVQERMEHNVSPIGGPLISIRGPALPAAVGKYHIVVDSGSLDGGPNFPPVSILQNNRPARGFR